MPDLPGYYMPHCTNCMAITHSVHNCPYNDEGDTMTSNYRDQLKGREQALYDDLQAVLRAHGYDDKHAKTLINTLGDDNA